jgi:hypothetical protein
VKRRKPVQNVKNIPKHTLIRHKGNIAKYSSKEMNFMS